MSTPNTSDTIPAGAYPASAGTTPSRRLQVALAPIVALAMGVGADLIFDPVDHHVPLCPLHALTGIWCPFCGGLRAVYLLAHGHLAAAASANVVLLLAIPWLTVRWIDGVRGQAPRRIPGPTWWPTAAVIVALSAFTIVRNLPFGSFLAPSGG